MLRRQKSGHRTAPPSGSPMPCRAPTQPPWGSLRVLGPHGERCMLSATVSYKSVTPHKGPVLNQQHSLPTPLTAPRSRLPPSRFICLRANCLGSKGKERALFVTGPTGRHTLPSSLEGARFSLRCSEGQSEDAVDMVSPLPGHPGPWEASAWMTSSRF